MGINRVYQNLLPLLIVTFLTTIFYSNAYSDQAEVNYTSYGIAQGVLNDVGDEIDRKETTLSYLFTIRNGIKAKLEETASNSRQNVKTSIKDRLTGEGLDAFKTLIDQIGETVDGVSLVRELESINTTIEEFIDIGIFQRKKRAITLSTIGM